MKVKVIIIVILILLLIGTFIYYNNKRPESYLSDEKECMRGYDKMYLQYPTEYGFSFQCCKKPHYLLQTIEQKLINHGIGMEELKKGDEE